MVCFLVFKKIPNVQCGLSPSSGEEEPESDRRSQKMRGGAIKRHKNISLMFLNKHGKKRKKPTHNFESVIIFITYLFPHK